MPRIVTAAVSNRLNPSIGLKGCTERTSGAESPRVINTDKHAAYPPAIAGFQAEGDLTDNCQHRPVQYLNNIPLPETLLRYCTGRCRTLGTGRSWSWVNITVLTTAEPVDQGTGTRIALLVTVVRPSRVSIKVESSGGTW